MVIAGAALIQGAKSQNLSSLDIGGADVHVHLSNCADERVPDDETCIAALTRGVKGVVILNGKTPHAVLLELFTEHGAGTLIVHDPV